MSPEPETSKSYGSNLASSAMPAAIHNETPARIILKGNHGNVLTLAPLETTRPILPETLKEFDLRSPLQRNLLRYVATEPKGRFESVFRSFIGVGFWFAILGVIFTVFTKPSWVVPSLGIGSIVFCIAVLVALLIAKRLAKTVIQIVTQSLTVTFMFVFGIGMPVATVYLFSDRCELFKSHPHFPLLLQGRALQLVFVLAASVLPGLLYFLFDRQCLTTLRRRFEQSIFRLDPCVTTLTDVRAKYGKQMEEVYGKEDARAGQSLRDPTITKESDPRRYVDAAKVPYLVLPPAVAKLAKTWLGDFATVVNLDNGKVSSAIYADAGNSFKIGEGSIALAEALGIGSNPRTGNSARHVFYLVFPGSGNHKPRPLAEINEEGKRLFESWGGMTRVNQCVGLM